PEATLLCKLCGLNETSGIMFGGGCYGTCPHFIFYHALGVEVFALR
ncbi:MAG: hypothetical protein QOH42_996, partial [Blastocatellia bacterium]|nr:hypothetical protein [Blastocatellia bacterium]